MTNDGRYLIILNEYVVSKSLMKSTMITYIENVKLNEDFSNDLIENQIK